MAKIGYIRVSTLQQNTERQLHEMELERTFTDKYSGKTKDRPELQNMMNYLRSGDEVYVHSLDRLARNVRDLIDIIDQITSIGASVHFIKENLHFNANKADPTSKLLMTIMGAIAEFERTLILERQREGIEIAQKKGVYRGRKPLEQEKIDLIREKYEQGVSISKIAKKLNLTRVTVYKYLPTGENLKASAKEGNIVDVDTATA